MPTPQPDQQYFATRTGEAFGAALVDKVQKYYSDPWVIEFLAKQRLAYRYYYDLNLEWSGWDDIGSTQQITRGGEEGELTVIRINHWRSLVRNQIAMITNAKFQWRPRAAKYDWESMEAAKRSKAALEHYSQSGGLEMLRIERVETAAVLGEGFTHHVWNMETGSEAMSDPSRKIPIRTGDIDPSNVLPFNIIRDTRRSWRNLPWVIVREPRANKWDLAERQRQKAYRFETQGFIDKAIECRRVAARIIEAPRGDTPIFAPGPDANIASYSEDEIELRYFYHLPGAALPRGRQVLHLADGTIVEDTDLEYGMFPLVRVTEASVLGASLGYPTSWESLGIQQLFDSLQTGVATNQSTFGVQLVRHDPGVDPRPIQVGGGMAVIAAKAGEIEPMQLTKSPAEVFPHMASLRQDMQLLMNQSGVNRGEAQGDRQSGSALALLSAETIRNASPFQTSDVEASRLQGRLVLRMLRRKALRPITIGVSRAGGTTHDMKITGKMLGDDSDVDVELENPLMQTTEGRVAFLQTLGQLKIPVTMDQALEMITSGRSEPVTDRVTEEGLAIQRENELIGQGKTPRALQTDDHLRHGRDHSSVMGNPASRDSANVVNAFMEHMFEHYSLAYGVPKEMILQDPMYRLRMMELAGVQPPQLAMPTPAAPPPSGATPIGDAGGAKPPPLPAGNPQAGALPSLPTNKATGDKYSPLNGGGTAPAALS